MWIAVYNSPLVHTFSSLIHSVDDGVQISLHLARATVERRGNVNNLLNLAGWTAPVTCRPRRAVDRFGDDGGVLCTSRRAAVHISAFHISTGSTTTSTTLYLFNIFVFVIIPCGEPTERKCSDIRERIRKTRGPAWLYSCAGIHGKADDEPRTFRFPVVRADAMLYFRSRPRPEP